MHSVQDKFKYAPYALSISEKLQEGERLGSHRYKNIRGSRRKFLKEPLKGTKILFCDRAVIFFTLRRTLS